MSPGNDRPITDPGAADEVSNDPERQKCFVTFVGGYDVDTKAEAFQ